jgi:hypothetical protein
LKPGLTPRGRLVIAATTIALAVTACAAPPAAHPAAPVALPKAPTGSDASASALAATLTAKLGANASLGGRQLFPSDNPWNTPVDAAPVDPNSDALIASIAGNLHADFGAKWNGGPFGIPYVVVKGSQKKVKVTFRYADESDKGKYPIPKTAPVEKGSDRHVLVLDRDHWKLYELFGAKRKKGSTSWKAGSGAIFDLTSNTLRPEGWTSADAAGLPILPGLVRYDEVTAGAITHALRFTVAETRRAYVHPATHWASDDTSANLPPMGMRVRLKAGFDISGFPQQARVVLQAMKTYGMIVADNGSNWFVSGAPDKRWHDTELNTLKDVPGSAFEVVAMDEVITG